MVHVITPQFEILTPLQGDAILKHIERCGRTCYQSFDKAGDDTALRFAKHIVDRHHESVIEHVSVSVKFITDRGITHEIVRHRLASFSQESTRYCCYAKDKFGHEITVVRPVQLTDDMPAYQTWFMAMEQAEKSYFTLLDQGQTPEVARAVLPTCLKAEIVVSANLREWRHIFQMRTAAAAHPDVRFLMQGLCQEFKRQIPILFDDITWTV